MFGVGRGCDGRFSATTGREAPCGLHRGMVVLLRLVMEECSHSDLET